MISTKPTILVTGEIDHLGIHSVQSLQNEGYDMVVLGSLVHNYRAPIESMLKAKLVGGDADNWTTFSCLWMIYCIAAIMHFEEKKFCSLMIFVK
ncbi:MAG: hypothetical protein ACFB4I_14810 [Cyanophyceae cyanobacterium]